jgi:acyl-CoA synthetase (AMP-forming)/AMP-acid ligase II
VRPDDVSDILFTSGTTGRSKGAMTAHRQSLAVAQAWAERGRLTSNDRYLVVNPFFHSFGFKAGILACLVSGATLVPQLVYDGGPCHVAGRVRADHGANRGRCGVVLAAGGFERNAANRQRYQRPPVGAEWTNRLARARRSARQ